MRPLVTVSVSSPPRRHRAVAAVAVAKEPLVAVAAQEVAMRVVTAAAVLNQMMKMRFVVV